MSKKKPYSRIENGKKLRELSRLAVKSIKLLEDKNAPEWYKGLNDEMIVTTERLIKLQDFIWVKAAADSAEELSAEFQAIKCPKARKLLVEQCKIMAKYHEVLTKRMTLGWEESSECTCKKAPAKKAK